jgi:hypothetical protein
VREALDAAVRQAMADAEPEVAKRKVADAAREQRAREAAAAAAELQRALRSA